MRFPLEAQVLCLLVCILQFACSAKPFWKHKDSKIKGNASNNSGTNITELADQLDAKHLVVIMSQGRSGSSLLCNLIANIVGVGRTVLASELFGSGAGEMQRNKDPFGQMVQHFAAGQKNAPKPGWAGFKWKPYYFDSEYGHALQWIGDKGVRIVYNFRNPLDVLMSKDKHDEVHLKGYCTKGDSRCIHKAVDLHTGPRLLQDLDALVHLMDVDMARAAEFHIPILCMNYTDVAEGSKWNQVKALQRIADFLLGVDRQPTEKDLKVDTVSTAPERQKDQIKNYAEVVKTLKGIKYQQLLH